MANRVLSGMRTLVHGYDVVSEWLKDALTKRLKNISPEKITEPNPRIAVPAVQALTYSMSDDLIREMFANLVAADMDADKKDKAHPAFVELIKEMTPLDTRLLQLLGVQHQVLFAVQLKRGVMSKDIGHSLSFEIEDTETIDCLRSLNNLQRLGLAERKDDRWPNIAGIDKKEERLKEQHQGMEKSLSSNNAFRALGLDSPPTIFVQKSGLYLTPMGKLFAEICIGDGSHLVHKIVLPTAGEEDGDR